MIEYTGSERNSNGCILIEVDGGAILGYNRALLLKNLIYYQSIERAAESIAISHEHARELIDVMNDSSRRPLVEIAKEIPGGARFTMTAEGQRALESFWELYGEFKLSLCSKMSKERKRLSRKQCVHK